MTQFFHDTVSNFEWEIAALPQQKTHATFFHLNTYQINASTPNMHEAWDFFKFLVSEEGQHIHAAFGQGVPSRRSVALSPEVFQSTIAVEHNSIAPFLDSVAYVRSNEPLTTLDDVFGAIWEDFAMLWEGEQDATQAATRLKPVLQSLLEQGRGF